MRRRTWLVVLLVTFTALGGCELPEEPADEAGGDGAAQTENEAAAAPTETSPPTIDLKGTGKTATQKFTIIGGVTVAQMTHQGSSNFSVSVLSGSTGDMVELLANVIGNYNGSRVVGLAEGEYAIDVEADGPWQIRIDQPRTGAGATTPPVDGQGPKHIGPVSFPGGLTAFQLKHSGESNFAVTLLNNDGDMVELLANEIGTFEGSKNAGVDEGVYWIDVEADGTWTVDW